MDTVTKAPPRDRDGAAWRIGHHPQEPLRGAVPGGGSGPRTSRGPRQPNSRQDPDEQLSGSARGRRRWRTPEHRHRPRWAGGRRRRGHRPIPAHGHSRASSIAWPGQEELIRSCRSSAANTSTGDAALGVVRCRVGGRGQGRRRPARSARTRVVAGSAVPQITAVRTWSRKHWQDVFPLIPMAASAGAGRPGDIDGE
ncbi:hypothetical protein FQR65_LT20062 [Abscondita terminalis]|nr:hypothetical protein FQR65_LT20062 [Abscondita terminalis]